MAQLSNDGAFAQVCNFASQSIGEAIDHLLSDRLAAHPGPPWREIIGMSYELRHEYFRIDADVIWEVLTVHLQPLHASVKKMLADLDQPGLPQCHIPPQTGFPAFPWLTRHIRTSSDLFGSFVSI